MRKLIVAAFTSLDGVMQAPGGPEEDTSGGFPPSAAGSFPLGRHPQRGNGGEILRLALRPPPRPAHLRHLRRALARTWKPIRKTATSTSSTRTSQRPSIGSPNMSRHIVRELLSWQNSQGLGSDVAATVRDLKKGDGSALLTQGSTELLQILLAADLVDEIRLLTFPLVLGQGKKLFGSGAIPAAFRLTNSTVSPSGVVIATYGRAGDIPTGSFEFETPTEAEIERRKTLT